MTQKKTEPKQLEKKRWKVAVLINVLPFIIGMIVETYIVDVYIGLLWGLGIYIIFTLLNILLLANVKHVIYANLIMFVSSSVAILLNTWLHYVNVSSDPMTPIVGGARVFFGGYVCFWITAISLSIYSKVIRRSKDKKPEQICEGGSLKRVGLNYIYLPKSQRGGLDDTE